MLCSYVTISLFSIHNWFTIAGGLAAPEVRIADPNDEIIDIVTPGVTLLYSILSFSHDTSVFYLSLYPVDVPVREVKESWFRRIRNVFRIKR